MTQNYPSHFFTKAYFLMFNKLCKLARHSHSAIMTGSAVVIYPILKIKKDLEITFSFLQRTSV